jgi:organic hydroperoxide reductase OsmC/OhrA
MLKQHHYKVDIQWTGNKGSGTNNYREYERSHLLQVSGKPTIECSADPAFRGDQSKYNPEDFLMASLSSCHMLWYLHLCADAGVIVTAYTDHAEGTMIESEQGGHFTEVILKPNIELQKEDMLELAQELHSKAHHFCFIANSCNFPILHQPVYRFHHA